VPRGWDESPKRVEQGLLLEVGLNVRKLGKLPFFSFYKLLEYSIFWYNNIEQVL